MLLRDTAKQVQDITTLSRDVEHANNALSPIFNKEKEQKRLKQAQLIGEIGAQVMDIVRTEGELKAQKAAEAKGDAKVKRPQDGDSAQEWEVYKKALTESPTYKAEMQKYGTGSDFQRAAQAATAAIQTLAGGDIQKAIASGASPYLAQLVKDVTIPKDESKITASDIAANAMAHAVVAQLSGQDAAAGAIGASSGELIARAIMADQYPGKTANDLTEEEKQSVSALSTLASGLVSGLAGNSTASAASGAQSGRNAVENNALGADAGTALGFWFGKSDECNTACKAEIAKGIAEGNLVVSAGVAGVAGGAMIVGATPEIVAAAKAALEGCKAAPTICLNNAGLQVAEAVTPGGVGAAGAIGVGKTVAEATVAKAEAVAANTTISMADRIKANIAESQKARESSNFGQYSKAEGGVQEALEIWPPNRGAYGPIEKVTLPIGETVDRYGYPGGSFVSPVGVPFTERALPSSYETTRPYFQYEIIKPIPDVPKSKILPWFGQKGTGTQYELPKPVQWYLDNHYMKKADK
ncbi:hypothetical protein BV921_20840 [Pectobacterium odoriferum]|nr:hypothetical protein BV921_20840 [Pectobacterium odoriferum]